MVFRSLGLKAGWASMGEGNYREGPSSPSLWFRVPRERTQNNPQPQT